MPLTVRLMGRVAASSDGSPAALPRGHKAWGLLAYVLVSPRPVSRSTLCDLLFADADDPRAALRWNLSALRKLLGPRLRSDQGGVSIVLEDGDDVDLLALGVPGVVDLEHLAASGGVLLEDMLFEASPGFATWLESERLRVRSLAAAHLHQGALTAHAAGEHEEAARLAAACVRLEPFDENHQALLVRALAAGGDGVAAARQVAACRRLFRLELGSEPGPALQAAASVTTHRPIGAPVAGRPGVLAQIDAGRAALSAGVVEAGLQCLRRAAFEAADLGDARLEARALVHLGSALVHAARGRDEEGLAALHRALALARGRLEEVVATAAYELAYVEFLRGRYALVEPWLQVSEEAAAGDPVLLAEVHNVRGCVRSDQGAYDQALAVLQVAAALAPASRPGAYALSMLGRVHLLCDRLDEAEECLASAAVLTGRLSWTSFLPWPESLQAHVLLARGDLDAAQERLDHAFAMSCQLGDPCWEGISGRGRGLVQAARGDTEGAVSTLLDARARCTRLPDGYVWVDAFILDGLCQVLAQPDPARADGYAVELGRISAACGMRHLGERARSWRQRCAVTRVRARSRSSDPRASTTVRGTVAALDGPGPEPAPRA